MVTKSLNLILFAFLVISCKAQNSAVWNDYVKAKQTGSEPILPDFSDEPQNNFNFISKDTWFWKIVPPIIVGFHGSGTTFNKEEVHLLESTGAPVEPESLFEAQLKLCLGYLPKWISTLKKQL